jgi:hypothetical protein
MWWATFVDRTLDSTKSAIQLYFSPIRAISGYARKWLAIPEAVTAPAGYFRLDYQYRTSYGDVLNEPVPASADGLLSLMQPGIGKGATENDIRADVTLGLHGVLEDLPSGAIQQASIRPALMRLRRLGLVRKEGERWVITPLGRKAVANQESLTTKSPPRVAVASLTVNRASQV